MQQASAGYKMDTRLKTNIYYKQEMQEVATTQMIGTYIKSNDYVPHVRTEQQRHVDKEFISRKIMRRNLSTYKTGHTWPFEIRRNSNIKLYIDIRIGHMYNVT